MADKHDDHREHIALGLENQRLLPRLARWCKHIDVRRTSAGLVAQTTGLPIGMLEVTCPHGVSVGESMHLAWETKRFVLHNCASCPYHQEIDPDNLGREILAEAATEQREAAQMAARRAELKREAYTQATSALGSERITEGSVNRLILDLLESPDGATPPGAEMLEEAARLGPEFFSNSALLVLADGFAGEHGASCVRAVQAVYRHLRVRGEGVPGTVLEAAARAIRTGAATPGGDAACDLLADHIVGSCDAGGALPLIPDVIAAPDYRLFRWRVPGGYRKRPRYPGTLRLLGLLFEREPAMMRAAYTDHIKIDQKDTRLNAAETLIDLLPSTATDLIPLAPILLRSLEQTDDRYEHSADDAVCVLLTHLYAYGPEEVEAEIERYYSHAPEEVKELILGIYARLARFVGRDVKNEEADFTGFPQEHYTRHLPRIVEKLYLAASDVHFAAETRRRLWDAFGSVLKAHPAEAVSRLDRVLARLALTVREADSAITDAEQVPSLLHREGQKAAYHSLIRSVSDLLDEAIALAPVAAFPQVCKALDNLNSAEDVRLKVQLVGTLGVFAVSSYDLVPEVVPQLYKHLVDFESVAVRAAAVRVVTVLLKEMPDSVPDEMIELLVAYLDETWVTIHKACVHAFEYYKFEQDERGRRAINSLLAWERTYAQKGNETDFLRKIYTTLRYAFSGWPEVERYVDTKLLPEYSQNADEYFAGPMIEELGRAVRRRPELATQYVQAAIGYLGRTWRDVYNDDTTSDRYDIWARLFDMPTSAIKDQRHMIAVVFREKSGYELIDAVRLLELLAYHGLHEDAAAMASEAQAATPENRRHACERQSYGLIAAAESIEAAVRRRDRAAALTAADNALAEFAPELDADEDSEDEDGQNG